jgi:hypothetical protein
VKRYGWVGLGFALMVLSAQAAGPCATDKENFCKGIQPGEGRIVKCLKEHEAQLSSDCKAHREKVKEHLKEVKEACHEDVEALCDGVRPGQGRIIKCLHEHKDKVSAACQSEMRGRK